MVNKDRLPENSTHPLTRRIENWRRYLLYIVLFGTAGVLAELYLLDHHEDWKQWIPLVLLSAGAAAGLWLMARPSRGAVRAFRALLAAMAPAGLLGVWFHYRSNVEFELEVHPDSGGLELLRESLGGAMPTLAPGAMILLGMLGILVALQHPAGGGGAARSSEDDAAGPAAPCD